MTYEAIRYELADGIATITLNRPAVHNAMNERMREELTACFGELVRSEDARVVVVTGTGERAFSAGADIREFVAPQVPVKFRDGRRRVDFRAAMDRCPQPIIAAIRGFALGGGLELALACDIRIAGEDSQLGLTEVNLAIIPGGGGTQRLPRLVGHGRAMFLNLTGDFVDAETAHAWGLVERVVPTAELEDAALSIAGRIASRSPHAVAVLRELARTTRDLPLEEGLRREAEGFARCLRSEDGAEGVAAFIEKREPEFTGR